MRMTSREKRLANPPASISFYKGGEGLRGKHMRASIHFSHRFDPSPCPLAALCGLVHLATTTASTWPIRAASAASRSARAASAPTRSPLTRSSTRILRPRHRHQVRSCSRRQQGMSHKQANAHATSPCCSRRPDRWGEGGGRWGEGGNEGEGSSARRAVYKVIPPWCV